MSETETLINKIEQGHYCDINIIKHLLQQYDDCIFQHTRLMSPQRRYMLKCLHEKLCLLIRNM